MAAVWTQLPQQIQRPMLGGQSLSALEESTQQWGRHWLGICAHAMTDGWAKYIILPFLTSQRSYKKHNLNDTWALRRALSILFEETVLQILEQLRISVDRGGSPWSSGGSPWSFEAYPGAMEAQPWAVEAHPGAVRFTLDPWRLTLELWGLSWSHGRSPWSRRGSPPWSCEVYPGAVEAHPGAVEAHPGALRLTMEPSRLTLELWRYTLEL